ncbi:helix-turn-helix transcriptional regulator [Kribbella rubisoli]|uniref:helix-turn-helix transcriptional regulator n=1 Tax=Kribbella rubisoli TaxID=3075929 RepID=UPI00102D1B75|nr:helix-turn-helix transcriptional regulator [Kribbella rubisoli]
MESTTATADGGLVERLRAARLPAPASRKSIREEAGATLRDIADELAVSPVTVLRWEQGKSEPRLEHAIRYRRLLDELREIA